MKKINVSKSTRAALTKKRVTYIDIGCGANKSGKDWFGIDYRKLDGVDLVQDLELFPWAIPSDSFNTAVANHVVEHINPSHGIFISFMNEAWRILKPEGELIIGAPYATSTGMFRDPTHVNFVNEETWTYFDPDDLFYHGGLYHIYAPLPWRIKINTWHNTGNLEVCLVKREILPEYKVDAEYLKVLKANTKLTK
jgi:SAM-dependent methyltransferase